MYGAGAPITAGMGSLTTTTDKATDAGDLTSTYGGAGTTSIPREETITVSCGRKPVFG